MAQDREIELKLLLNSGDVKRLLAWPTLRKAGPPGRTRLLTTYFDTPDHQLSQAGLHLRVRERSGTWLQTVKSTRAGLERGEWERPIGSPTPVDEVGDDGPGDRLLRRKSIRAALRPCFRIDVERTTWALSRDASTVECALDEGSIIAGDARQAICEVELELERGDPEVLFRFAREIGGTVPVALSLTSKGRRGFRLESGRSHTTEKPAPLLRLKMTAQEGARTVLLASLAVLLDMAAMLRAAPGVETVHQTRVALRRLRAGLSLFRRAVDRDAAARLKPALSALSGHLGRARDIDVLLQHLEGSDDGSARFRELHTGLRARREAAYAELLDDLRGPAHLGLMLDVLHLASGNGRSGGKHGKRHLGRYLARELEARFDTLLTASRHLRRLSPEDRHAVRIRAKKLRYMIELCASVAPRRRYKALRDGLESLQETLGALNDVVVAQDIVREITGDGHAADLFGSPELNLSTGKTLKKASAARRRLTGTTPFWSGF